MASPAASTTGIGARIPRRELKRLLAGHGRYIDDIRLSRMLHAYFVRSPHPHAKLVSIDVQKAITESIAIGRWKKMILGVPRAKFIASPA